MLDRTSYSFLVAAYNAQTTLDATVKSLLAQNSDIPFEILIVDDGSTDETLATARAYTVDNRVRVFTKDNGGAASAAQVGYEHARGDYVARVDADDTLNSDFLTTMDNVIRSNPNFEIFASNALRCFDDGSKSAYLEGTPWNVKHEITLDELMRANTVYVSALVKRPLIAKAGGYTSAHFNEDYDLWLRLVSRGARVLYTPEKLANYSVHAGQKTSDGARVRRDDIAILEEVIASGLLSKEQRDTALRTIKVLKVKALAHTLLRR